MYASVTPAACGLTMWMIPQLPHPDGADLWIADFGEARPPPEISVDIESVTGVSCVRLAVDWQRIADHTPATWIARPRLRGLAPNSNHRLWLLESGRRHGAPAHLRTLPTRLPGPMESPLTLLLGSCFDYRGAGAVAIPALRRFLNDHRFPHLKLLCGDQVYVDNPVFERVPRNEPDAYRFVLRKYLRNWAPAGGSLANGYGDFLRHGANLFLSDDHEFWNNYPFSASHIPITHRKRGRQLLGGLATQLFRGFQAASRREPNLRGLQEVVVGTPGAPGHLELFALDGRVDRTAELSHWPGDLDHLCRRLRSLRGPAILALSQPLFERAQPALRRRWIDAGIVDFDDYGPLAAALAAAPHDILILSGDIHCGRIAEVTAARGPRLVEVVASPISLIARTKYYDSPAHSAFPSRALSGHRVASRPVEMRVGPIKRDHVATIQIHAKDRGVEVEVCYVGVADQRLLAEWRTTLY